MQVEYWTGRGGSTLHLHHKHMEAQLSCAYDGGELGSTDRDRQVENCGLTA